MRKTEKVAYIIDQLERLYPKPVPPLDHKDAYTLLIAVTLSARCTDERVNKITPLLFEKADNPYQMIQLDVDEIQEIIRPCGLSRQKAEGIWKMSKRMVEEFDGQVPKDMETLETFPAVGHKTASVVMAQAFDVPAFPVDTHIQRMMQRWRFVKKGGSIDACEKAAKKAFPKEKWIDLHLQIIYYAREYSPARSYDMDLDFITSTVIKPSA